MNLKPKFQVLYPPQRKGGVSEVWNLRLGESCCWLGSRHCNEPGGQLEENSSHFQHQKTDLDAVGGHSGTR